MAIVLLVTLILILFALVLTIPMVVSDWSYQKHLSYHTASYLFKDTSLEIYYTKKSEKWLKRSIWWSKFCIL